ncbi:hypothetical protein F2P56_031670, partial [Juglans regia]
ALTKQPITSTWFKRSETPSTGKKTHFPNLVSPWIRSPSSNLSASEHTSRVTPLLSIHVWFLAAKYRWILWIHHFVAGNWEKFNGIEGSRFEAVLNMKFVLL